MNKFLALLMVVVFISCKKDNTKDLLTRSWQISAITVKTTAGVNTPQDISSCSQSRIWTFQDNGRFLSEPTPNCIPDGPDFVLNGTWNLANNDTLKIEAQGGYAAMFLKAKIVMATQAKLVLRTQNNFGAGGGGFRDTETTYELTTR